MRRAGTFSVLIVPAVVVLAVVLVGSSLLTLTLLDDVKMIYLRGRAGAVTARLEASSRTEWTLQRLAQDEPSLVNLEVFDRSASAAAHDRELEPIWSGRELFRTWLEPGVFIALIPFHQDGRLQISRVTLDARAADPLTRPARTAMTFAAFSGIVLVLLALYAVWMSHRAAVLDRQRLKLDHLARLGAVSAALAHEIRNPLGAVKGFIQLAAEKSPPPVLALLEPALRETGRLERLSSDLLLYGRPREPFLRDTEWRALAAELEAYARQAIGDRPIRISIENGPGHFPTDPDLLKQALLNLLANSLEALGRAEIGRVHIKAEPHSGRGLTIVVEDDGAGIPGWIIARLSEPFLTTKPQGTGLGLAITRKVAALLGGRLEIAAVTPHGTRAALVFPETIWSASS